MQVCLSMCDLLVALGLRLTVNCSTMYKKRILFRNNEYKGFKPTRQPRQTKSASSNWRHSSFNITDKYVRKFLLLFALCIPVECLLKVKSIILLCYFEEFCFSGIEIWSKFIVSWYSSKQILQCSKLDISLANAVINKIRLSSVIVAAAK